MSYEDTRKIVEGFMKGAQPIKRLEPKPGQSQYYYYDPMDKSPLSERRTFDVADATSPNPGWKGEQKDYLYYLNKSKDELCSPQFEGNYDYAYLDNATLPNPTIGCGVNINATPDIVLQNRFSIFTI